MSLVPSVRLSSLVLGLLLVAPLIPILQAAFAQESQHYVNRSTQIWGDFYRYMYAAFVFGALVQAAIIFISIRFNEKNVAKRQMKREMVR